MPASASIAGLTNTMYTIVTNVVTPATTSVRTFEPSSRILNNFSSNIVYFLGEKDAKDTTRYAKTEQLNTNTLHSTNTVHTKYSHKKSLTDEAFYKSILIK
eukprot:GHVR01071705.1.p1 GENE.GHVR01071705.1~~GHVR01071705.1.p1  ORF type:complete len:101 (+),score=1.54 GHVR01071705.1:154-456(+)